MTKAKVQGQDYYEHSCYTGTTHRPPPRGLMPGKMIKSLKSFIDATIHNAFIHFSSLPIKTCSYQEESRIQRTENGFKCYLTQGTRNEGKKHLLGQTFYIYHPISSSQKPCDLETIMPISQRRKLKPKDMKSKAYQVSKPTFLLS